jgi:hypothetical protein
VAGSILKSLFARFKTSNRFKFPKRTESSSRWLELRSRVCRHSKAGLQGIGQEEGKADDERRISRIMMGEGGRRVRVREKEKGRGVRRREPRKKERDSL